MLLIKSSFNSVALVRLVNAVVTCIFSGLQFHSSGSVVGYHIEQENLFHTLSPVSYTHLTLPTIYSV